jgi:hypothetical protein
MNRIKNVRTQFPPPGRGPFKPAPPRASSNTLISQAVNNRTKRGVVRLPRRKWAERGEKRPEVGLSRGPGGSDNLSGMAPFCGIPTANQGRKKNVLSGKTGGAKLTRCEHSFRWSALNHHAGAQPHDQGVYKQGRGPRRDQDGDERPFA